MAERTLVLFLDAIIIRQFSSLQTRDAIHAATMLHAGIRRILTTNRLFDAVKGIRRVDPARLPRLPKPS